MRSITATIATLAVLALLPAAAHAQSKSGQGTSMNMAAATGAEAFGCETRFQPGLAPPHTYERQPTGMSSCTAYQPGQTVDDSHLVPGPGTVTKVRVKSGPNPAPLRVTIIKRLFQTNPNNPSEITDATCCTGTGRESATFQPTPNAVTEVTVNLPVTTTPSTNGSSGHHDIVAVSGVGPGDLPIASTGEHSLSAAIQASTPTMQIFYPKVETGLQGQSQHDYANYVVLMNYDWTACAVAAGATASQACAPAGGTPVPPAGTPGGGGTGVVAPLRVKSRSLRLKKGRVRVRVACTAPKGTPCRGKARLRTRGSKPKLLATRALRIAGGRTATVTFKLSKKARNRVRKKSNKVSIVMDLGAAGKATKNLKLKR